MNHFSLDGVIKPTKLQLFELLFPKSFIFETILPAINERIEGNAVIYHEFLQLLGIWFTMATCQGFSRNEFWSTMPLTGTLDQLGAPYRFNNIMSRYRFNAILRNIRYNLDEPPAFRDRFCEVRDLIKWWNDNMDEQFSPSWISCLDESLFIWTNEYTCPGYMFVPRKPHPFGTSITQFVVVFLVFFTGWSLWRVRIGHPNVEQRSIRFLGRLLGCCFV